MEYNRFLVKVDKGEYFEIGLDTNEGSTGYVWCVSALDGPILLLGYEEQEPVADEGYGTPHKKVYQFIPDGVGQGKVVFKLVRPWLPKEVQARYEYIIQIEE